MAGSNVLREVFVSLGLQVDKNSFKQGENAVEGLVSAAKKLGVGLGLGAIALGIRHTINEITELGDRLDETSQITGVATDELQALQHVFKKGGVDSDSLTQALVKLSKAAAEAGDNAASDTGKAFQRFGIHVKDAGGNLRTTDDLLLAVADGLGTVKSSTERAALATQFFGRAGAQLLPTIGQGSKDVRRLVAEFKKLGGGLSAKTIADSAKYRDAIDDLTAAWTALKGSIVGSVLPGLITAAEKATSLVGRFRDLDARTGIVADGLKSLAVVALAMGVSFIPAIVTTLAWGVAIGALALAWNDLSNFMKGNDSVIGDILEKNPEFRQQLDDILTVVIELQKAFTDLWESFEKPWKSPAFQATLDLLNIVNPLRFVANTAGGVKMAITGELSPLQAAGEVLSQNLMPFKDAAMTAFQAGDQGNPFGKFAVNPATVSSINVTVAEGAISVSGAGDPASTSDAIMQQLRDHLGTLAADAHGALTPNYSGGQ